MDLVHQLVLLLFRLLANHFNRPTTTTTTARPTTHTFLSSTVVASMEATTVENETNTSLFPQGSSSFGSDIETTWMTHTDENDSSTSLIASSLTQVSTDSMEESPVDQVVHTVLFYSVVLILLVVTLLILMRLARHFSIVSTWFAYRRVVCIRGDHPFAFMFLFRHE